MAPGAGAGSSRGMGRSGRHRARGADGATRAHRATGEGTGGRMKIGGTLRGGGTGNRGNGRIGRKGMTSGTHKAV